MNVMFGTDAIRYPLTGIGRYTYEVGSRLSKVASIDSIRYFRSGKVHEELPQRTTTGRADKASMRLRRLGGSLSIAIDAYRHLSAALQERALRKYKDYVFHGPNYYLPVHSGPCVTTFHDLSVFLWPECHPVIRVRYMQKELPIALKRAQVILTDSEFTRQEVSAYFNWPLSHIVVAPLAASTDFRPMTPPEVAPALSQWGLCFGSYSLFVGTLDPRKNVDMLLDAYERMPKSLRKRNPLVVAGFEGWKSQHTITRLKVGMDEGWAHYLGFVDEALLPALYAGARVFLYPSRYEGFGLPVLEAMAAGVPVICSNAASLPEVTGDIDDAMLISPDDTDAFYDALIKALEDNAWSANARHRGLERAQHFSWDKTVAATLAAYRLASK